MEDEKAIRMGLRSIVERAPIKIETVLDCKNGAEAWELLQSRTVDVLFTDIRMPKMDGVELVERSKGLPVPPISIVISGYDDFSYAVGAFRQGVRDYLLKPIERERVFEILKNLDAELEDKRKQLESGLELRRHLYRSLILGAPAAESVLSRQLDPLLFNPYVVACVSSGLDIAASNNEICVLKALDGHQALIAKASALPHLRQSLLHNCCAGISGETDNPARLCAAYHEAIAAREYAFVHGNTETYADLTLHSAASSGCKIEDRLVQIIQLLGASHIEEAQTVLEQTLFLAQNGKIDPSAFIKGVSALPDRIIEVYGFFLEAKERLRNYENPWMWDNAFEYCQCFQNCIADVFAKRAAQSQDDLRAKIHKAVMHAKNNFRSNINMAMVSNEVSMNYTQFSYLFKEYTGSNFLVFLRSMRLEEGKKLLATTDLSIAKIAKESGFQNEKHFMKSFKQSLGVSPSVYRKNIHPGD